MCTLRKTKRRREKPFRAGYNIDTNRNTEQWKRIENPEICAEVCTKISWTQKGFEINVEKNSVV